MAIPSAMSASTIQTDYMKLLVTQLQNQDPLEPMSNDQMAAQLAQFSQLEQLESMNGNFAKVLETTEFSYATSLIGKEVTFIGDTGTGDLGAMAGSVDRVFKGDDGKITLEVGNYSLEMDDVMSIRN